MMSKDPSIISIYEMIIALGKDRELYVWAYQNGMMPFIEKNFPLTETLLATVCFMEGVQKYLLDSGLLFKLPDGSDLSIIAWQKVFENPKLQQIILKDKNILDEIYNLSTSENPNHVIFALNAIGSLIEGIGYQALPEQLQNSLKYLTKTSSVEQEDLDQLSTKWSNGVLSYWRDINLTNNALPGAVITYAALHYNYSRWKKQFSYLHRRFYLRNLGWVGCAAAFRFLDDYLEKLQISTYMAQLISDNADGNRLESRYLVKAIGTNGSNAIELGFVIIQLYAWRCGKYGFLPLFLIPEMDREGIISLLNVITNRFAILLY